MANSIQTLSRFITRVQAIQYGCALPRLRSLTCDIRFTHLHLLCGAAIAHGLVKKISGAGPVARLCVW